MLFSSDLNDDTDRCKIIGSFVFFAINLMTIDHELIDFSVKMIKALQEVVLDISGFHELDLKGRKHFEKFLDF